MTKHFVKAFRYHSKSWSNRDRFDVEQLDVNECPADVTNIGSGPRANWTSSYYGPFDSRWDAEAAAEKMKCEAMKQWRNS